MLIALKNWNKLKDTLFLAPTGAQKMAISVFLSLWQKIISSSQFLSLWALITKKTSGWLQDDFREQESNQTSSYRQSLKYFFLLFKEN